VLEASSPDEIALVKFSYSMNMQLRERERLQCTIKNAAGINENYQVLEMFPFTSESKKMSVLLKSKETGRIVYFVKGAEVVMERFIKP
jgi:phospholipid-translocating ATPase